MELERPYGCNHNRCIGAQPRLSTFDIEKLFGTKIGAKARFGDNVVTQAQRCPRCDDRIASVGNVGERSTMYQGRGMFKGLDQIRP